MKGKLNNKGYSLVELLLTLVIFSVVMLGIVMIMRTTAVSYRNGSFEVNTQTEAQIVANQIEELFVDGTGNYSSGSVSGCSYYGITSDNATHFVIYKAAADEIWYQKVSGAATSPSEESSAAWSLMAENVTGMNISGFNNTDASLPTCDNMITVTVDVDQDGYTYTAVKDVYFRNVIEDVSVMQIPAIGGGGGLPVLTRENVYVSRYQVLDLVKDYDIDLTQPVIINGFTTGNYKLVVPTYNTNVSNDETYKAITGITDATMAECVAAGCMAVTTTDTLNNNFTSVVGASANVTIDAKDNDGNAVRLQLLTKAVDYEMHSSSSPDSRGVVYLSTTGGSSGKYSWIDIDGIDITDMITLGGEEFRYSVVMYNDADGDMQYDAGEQYESVSVSGPKPVTTINTVAHDTGGSRAQLVANGPKTAIGLMSDPEGDGFVVVIKENSATTDAAIIDLFANSKLRVAFLIELPCSNKPGGHDYQIVDLTLALNGLSFVNYKGGAVYSATSTSWSGVTF